MAKQTRKQAVEQRTQQVLAQRKEAARRGAEARKHPSAALRTGRREGLPPKLAAKFDALKEHEAKLVAETRKMLDAEAAAEAKASQAPKQRTKQPERATVRRSESRAGGEVSAAMATVALRGEQAARFRALASKQGVSLAKLLRRMMEVFEARSG